LSYYVIIRKKSVRQCQKTSANKSRKSSANQVILTVKY
jgi:hypothetical protein